jgi:sugar phosphate isomerase/epimerase
VGSNNLDDRLPLLVEAVEQTGVVVAAVNHGHCEGMLSADTHEREQALAALRRSICDAADLGASGVVFVPHAGSQVIPDLTPFLSAEELQAELLNAHLRTLEDYAAAMGARLYMRVVKRQAGCFPHRVEQGAAIVRKRGHPYVCSAAGTGDMFQEEHDLVAALHAAGDSLGYLLLADVGAELPGQGGGDFRTLSEALRSIAFDGWCTIECGQCGSNSADAVRLRALLPESLAYLRAVEIV